ncbi:hypothetical protein J3R82DRAFT_6963 [Butyriboletus roseoflavus]|nr:hypothetical protein J3R82DRAFT_6963 [Butyriboletus roseoflavus]
MPWYSPPSRRELSLVFFSLTIFVLFYNLENSFTNDALSGRWTASQANNKSANSNSENEDWDDVIYGNWTWQEGQVAENAQKLALNKTFPPLLPPQIFGTVGVNDGILNWDNGVPTTTVLKHVPGARAAFLPVVWLLRRGVGYTIMDNLFMLNGTLFAVTDDPTFPPLDSIASSGEDSHAIPRSSDWQILSSVQAREILGPFGGLIHGVSWIVTDASPSNYTFFSLWRTYSALDTSLSPDALTLPPPRRVFYPNVPALVGKPQRPGDPYVVRQRSPSGFHPFVAKAAFPTLGLMYKDDWADYELFHVPFLIKRAVVADEGAARRARADVPPFAVPLVELEASKKWWEPIRRGVARFLGVAEQAPNRAWLSKAETVVTYLSRQDAAPGPKLRKADHEALIEALRELGEGYTVHVVSSEAPWVERMTAIAQSTIVIGVHGAHMADCVYMPPSSRATVMEMFPPGVFIQDAEMAVRALDGVGYIAWWEARQHGVNALPPVVPPDEKEKDEVPLDVPTMMRAIRRIG